MVASLGLLSAPLDHRRPRPSAKRPLDRHHVSLAGGRVVGILGGVVLLSSISHVVNLLGVSAWYPQLLKGAIILLGAAAYAGRREVARESAAAP